MKDPKLDSKGLQGVVDSYKKKIVIDDLRDTNENLQIESMQLMRAIERQKKALKHKDETIHALSTRDPSPSRSIDTIKTITIAQAIVKYVKFQIERNTWSDKIIRQRKGYLSVFADIVGQKNDISMLNQDTITEYQRILRQLPANVNKYYELPQAVELRPEHYKKIAQTTNKNKLSARGLESHFNSVKPFLTWCVDIGYLTKDHRKLLNVGKREIQKTQKKVLPFSSEHLSRILTSYIYSEYRLPREKPNAFQFWMPLLGLFTGARESEIANLRISDIKIINDILSIDINDNHAGKSLKTEASRRCVPLAKIIIDAGFESFVEHRIKSCNTNDSLLFELPNHRDGVARAVSKWFNENFKKKCNLTTEGNTKVCFHSFRHTFINKLGSTKVGNDLVPDRIVKEIVGHEMGDVTNDVYGHEHDYVLKKEIIDCIDYGIDLSTISYSRFLKRKPKK
ncbi:site-specific integrase [Thalassotalea sp. G2M2-11]|uniref:site-specific integrase n=1 Tax=Thalassotalea sp. G2M2-11 TaxID=2787627 RepID=UPI0019D0DFBA|nr:site-specific integrase [Thalassotalea sp. G2M2-11]